MAEALTEDDDILLDQPCEGVREAPASLPPARRNDRDRMLRVSRAKRVCERPRARRPSLSGGGVALVKWAQHVALLSSRT